MNYPYWEYNKKEITIYFSEHHYVTYYDDDADALYQDLELGTDKCREDLLNELHLDYEHNDPHNREL